MTNSFEDKSYEEEPVILESEAKTASEAFGRNNSPRSISKPIELFQAKETESVKILIKI